MHLISRKCMNWYKCKCKKSVKGLIYCWQDWILCIRNMFKKWPIFSHANTLLFYFMHYYLERKKTGSKPNREKKVGVNKTRIYQSQLQ